MGQYLQGWEKKIPVLVRMKEFAVWGLFLENAPVLSSPVLSSLQCKQVGALFGWELPWVRVMLGEGRLSLLAVLRPFSIFLFAQHSLPKAQSQQEVPRTSQHQLPPGSQGTRHGEHRDKLPHLGSITCSSFACLLKLFTFLITVHFRWV